MTSREGTVTLRRRRNRCHVSPSAVRWPADITRVCVLLEWRAAAAAVVECVKC